MSRLAACLAVVVLPCSSVFGANTTTLTLSSSVNSNSGVNTMPAVITGEAGATGNTNAAGTSTARYPLTGPGDQWIHINYFGTTNTQASASFVGNQFKAVANSYNNHSFQFGPPRPWDILTPMTDSSTVLISQRVTLGSALNSHWELLLPRGIEYGSGIMFVSNLDAHLTVSRVGPSPAVVLDRDFDFDLNFPNPPGIYTGDLNLPAGEYQIDLRVAFGQTVGTGAGLMSFPGGTSGVYATLTMTVPAPTSAAALLALGLTAARRRRA